MGLGREIGLCTQTPAWSPPVLHFASTSGELEQHFWRLCENAGDGSHLTENQGLRRQEDVH